MPRQRTSAVPGIHRVGPVGVVCLLLLVAGCQTTDQAGLGNSDAYDVPEPILEVAETAEREGNHLAAAQQYLSLYEKDDDRVDYLIGAARNLRYQGSSEDGLRLLLRDSDRFGENAAFRSELGKTRIAAGKHIDAIDDLTFAVTAAPDSWDAYSALGIAYDLSENYDAAHAAYAQAVVLSDADPGVLNNFAISKALSGDIEGAIAFLESHPRAIRRSSHIRQNLAMFMAIQGDLTTAGELARMDLDETQVNRNLEFFGRFRGE